MSLLTSTFFQGQVSGSRILVLSSSIKSPFVHFSAFSNFFHHYYIYGEYPDCQKYKDWSKKCVAFKVTKDPAVKVSSYVQFIFKNSVDYHINVSLNLLRRCCCYCQHYCDERMLFLVIFDKFWFESMSEVNMIKRWVSKQRNERQNHLLK